MRHSSYVFAELVAGKLVVVAESFFATLKTEIGTRVWASRAEARKAVFVYLTYYNQQRLHSTPNYRTPYETRVCCRQHHALAA